MPKAKKSVSESASPELEPKVASAQALTTDIEALLALVDLVAEVANDTQDVLGKPSGIFASLNAYGDLLPKFITLLPQLSELPKEMGDLSPADISFLIETLVKKLNIKSVQARNILDASIATLNALALHVAIELQGLISAIKGA